MKTGKIPRWKSIKDRIATPSLPEIGPAPRPDRLSIEELSQRLDSWLAQRHLPRSLHRPLRAAALLWHDHLDASHSISQEIHNADGNLLHGIMHRREPDYSNAKYWFHRVGKHPCYPQIASGVAHLLEGADDPGLASRLVPRGQWDPFAFVDLCEEATGPPGATSRLEMLKRIQEIEFDALLAHLFRGVDT